MGEKKFIKPSNRKLVFHKKTGKWIDSEDEKAYMELERVKREQAQKQLQEQSEELDDEPHAEDELIVCPVCKEWTSKNEGCCS